VAGCVLPVLVACGALAYRALRRED